MSMELMVKAMKTKVGNPLRKLVLLKLADNANDAGECWPSLQYIADQCEVSRSSVKNHIRELESAGLVTRQYRKTDRGNQSNIYHITLGQKKTDMGQHLPEVGQQVTEGRSTDAPPPRAADAPRTSHSLEPITEPVNEPLIADSKKSAKPSGKKSASRKVALPDEFKPTAQHVELANKSGVDLNHEFEQFKDYHKAKDSKMVDWHAALRTWIRNAAKFAKSKPVGKRAGYLAGNSNQMDYSKGIGEDGKF